MVSSIGISLSGLNAAATRLGNSANNVANVHSTGRKVNGERVAEPYVPTDVVQSSIEPQGGVHAELRERDPASVEVYAPYNGDADENGIVKYPNVNLENEVVDQMIASYDFKANLKMIETADKMLKGVLDIQS